MEFLMTYGWAILVVLVAIGALAYFGMLNPDRFLPSKCNLGAGFTCVDHQASAGTDKVTLIIKNGLGYDINTGTVTIEGCPTVATTGAGDCDANIPGAIAMNNGDQCTFLSAACPAGLTDGAKFSADVSFGYKNAETGLTHTSRGTVTTRVEP